MLKIIPLGGLGEIGLNMMVFEYGETMVIVDAGLMFPEDYMLGVDIVIPDLDFIRRNAAKVCGIVLTHGHEDHIGALPYLLREVNVPIYGTPFTLGLVRHKLQERDMLQAARLQAISSAAPLRLGAFELEFIDVCHSVVGGVGVAFRTPLGIVIHTGDFKIGHDAVGGMRTDLNKFACLGQEGVLALLSDSTNVEKEGYTISDREIGETLTRIITAGSGRTIVVLFASSIGRIQQVIDIAPAARQQGGHRRSKHRDQRRHRPAVGLPEPAARDDHRRRGTRRAPRQRDHHHHHRQPGRADVRPGADGHRQPQAHPDQKTATRSFCPPNSSRATRRPSPA